MTIVRFHPQAWVNDYAVDVDREGPSDFEVPAELIAGMKSNSDASDELRNHPSCPEWARDWQGPFYMEIEP